MPQATRPKRFIPFHQQSNEAQHLLIKGVCLATTQLDYPQLSVFKNMLHKIGLVVFTEIELEEMANQVMNDTERLDSELQTYAARLQANEEIIARLKEVLNAPRSTVAEKIIALQDVLRDSKQNQIQNEERRSTSTPA